MFSATCQDFVAEYNPLGFERWRGE
jgi:hypothetical protein